MKNGPLSGIRAVTCSTAQAGTVPYMLMADMGAEIIKIELPKKGDGGRKAGEVIGEVSSGTFSPTLNCGIGLAYIKIKQLPENNALFVDIRGKKTKAMLVDLPFTNSKALE